MKHTRFGELGTSSEVARYARGLSLRAINRVTPEVLQRLHDDVLPIFLKAHSGAVLHKAIATWARSVHLDADWIKDVAKHTLAMWAQEPPEKLDWGMPLDQYLPRKSKTLLVKWNPKMETAAAFKSRVRQEVDRFQTQLRSAGWLRQREIRSPQVFEWLLLHQVRGLSYSRIANEAGRTRRTVEEGVKALAALLTIPPRKLPLGRPKGARDKRRRRRVA